MKEAASYIISNYSFIFNLPHDQLLNIGNQFKDGNPIPSFDENLLINLCTDAQHIFEKENNVLYVEGNFVIVGDIHGSFHDLVRILKFIQENPSKVLFLGDYVDRGNFSLECITILFAIKVLYPNKFFLIRGNHEFDSLCRQYGFRNEIINHINSKIDENSSNYQKNLILTSSSYSSSEKINIDSYNLNNDLDHYKYTEKLYKAFLRTFSYLPICAIINSTTFCIHGGLSPKLYHIDQLNKIHRPVNNFEDDLLLSDVIWSDPLHGSGCFFQENPRGLGNLFNGDAVTNFLKANSLSRIIRAHQCVCNGSLKSFGDKCITVFSASSYNKSLDNCSAILQLYQKDDHIQISTFPPIQRLQKEEAFYYKVQTLNPDEERIPICFSLSHPKLTTNYSQRCSPMCMHRINSSIMKKQKSIGSLPKVNKNPKKIPQPFGMLQKPVINDFNLMSSIGTPIKQ